MSKKTKARPVQLVWEEAGESNPTVSLEYGWDNKGDDSEPGWSLDRFNLQ